MGQLCGSPFNGNALRFNQTLTDHADSFTPWWYPLPVLNTILFTDGDFDETINLQTLGYLADIHCWLQYHVLRGE